MDTRSRRVSVPGVRRLAIALAAALPLTALSAPAAMAADDELPPPPEAGELALEGIGKLMRALEIFIDTIPQYGTPYIDDRGNIVIPRTGEPADPDAGDPAIEETGTTT